MNVLSEIAQEAPQPGAGSLAPGIFPGLLRALYVGRRTGMLRFSRGEEHAGVCFAAGSIVFGSADIRECLMGETFVRHGLIRPDQLQQALEASSSSEKRLGEALLELGVLGKEQLDRALALHVREILLCVFAWSGGSYAFEELDAARLRGMDRPLPLSTAEVILDAVWSVADPEVIRRTLGSLDRLLLPATDPLLRFQHVSLAPADGFLLSRVDGTLTARQVLAAAATTLEEAERSLLGLLCVGMVEFAATPAWAAPPSHASSGTQENAARRREVLDAYEAVGRHDHYQTLGVSQDATPDEIKAAYFGLARRLHPDAQHEPCLADLGAELHAVFARVNEAFGALAARSAAVSREPTGAASPAAPTPPPGSRAPARPREDMAPEPAQAADPIALEEELGRARQSLSEGRILDALGAAHRVFEAAEGKLRQRARLVKARAYSADPSWKKEAERELRAAVRENPRNAEAFLLLGRLYTRDGFPERAQSMFRRALSLDPTHDEARAALRAASPPEAASRGLLSRLFRRS